MSVDFYRFPLISMDFHGFEKFLGQGVSRPLASCGILWRPVAACRTGLDPSSVKISDSEGLDLEAWVAWMLEGLEWIGEGDGSDGGDWDGRTGLKEKPTRSSFRSSADLEQKAQTYVGVPSADHHVSLIPCGLGGLPPRDPQTRWPLASRVPLWPLPWQCHGSTMHHGRVMGLP